MLSDEQVAQFQMLYKTRFGEEITKEEACEQGSKLIQLMRAVYRPMPVEEFNLLKHYYDEINQKKV